MRRLTILMPVYNGEQFLTETIDSVLTQTFNDYDFLIINDGSTDNSESIIKSYKDTRIKYLSNEVNLGLVKTLNKGIELTNTEFLARMDADDLWEPSKLDKQIRLMDENPEVGLCGTSVRKFGNINGDFIFPRNNETLKVGFLFYCTMSHPSVVYRTSFLKESGLRYRSEYFPAEDYKMWIDCIDKTQVRNIPEILVYYRQHEQQICQEKQDSQKEKTDNVRMEILKKIYPKITEDEKQFHLNEFVVYSIISTDDIRKHKRWANKLIKENSFSRYIKPSVMGKELNRYLQVSIKGYLINRYFTQYNVSNLVRYFSSGNWRYLSFRRNIGILKKCI